MPISFSPPSSNYSPEDRESWLPRLGTGRFYVNDRGHYLYADKRTRTLRDVTLLVYVLSDTPKSDSVQVKVEGVPYTNFQVRGNELWLLLDDQESFAALWEQLENDLTQWDFILHGFGFAPSNEVQVTYETLTWQGTDVAAEPAGNTYVTETVVETFKIKNADRIEYRLTERDSLQTESDLVVPTGFLLSPPQDCAPVVLTDDSIEYSDARGFQTEFAIDYTESELTFNTHRNYLQNPSFEVSSTGVAFTEPLYNYPLEWEVNAPGLVSREEGDAYHGKYCYRISGSGHLIQTVEIDPRDPWIASAHFIDGSGKLCVSFLDENDQYLDETGALLGPVQPNYEQCLYEVLSTQAVDSTGWTRVALHFGDETPLCDDPVLYPLPSNVAKLEIKLKSANGTPCVDAAALEASYRLSDFEPLDPNMTLEYDTSRLGYWLPTRTSEVPFEIHQLDLNPVNVPTPGGYLFAEEFSDREDFQLGKGGLSADPTVDPSGVIAPPGPPYYQFGRQFLPYAQTSGFTKLRQRQTFHLRNPAPLYDVTDRTVPGGNPLPIPTAIEYVQLEGFAVISNQLRFYVVPDDRIPIRLDAFILDQHSNPVFVQTATVTVTSGTVAPDDPQTSHHGQITFTYTPADLAGTGDLGKLGDLTIRVGDLVDTIPIHGYRPAGVDFDAYLT